MAVHAIVALEVVPDDLRVELDAATRGRKAGSVPTTAGLTSPAMKALELAAKEGGQLRHNYLGCEHLLLGLLREPEGLAGRVLASMGLDVAGVRSAVLAALSGYVPAGTNAPGSGVDDRLRDLSDRVAALEVRLG
jgi:ATP-dependent Clp protease ATP-binding subunit ClpC